MDAKKEEEDEDDENVVWFVNDVSRCWQSYSAVAVGHDSVAARTTTTTTRLPSLPHPENRTTTSVRQENRPTAEDDGKREEVIFPLTE